MQQALIYLAAGFIAVPLFKRLGLGSVLGFLVHSIFGLGGVRVAVTVGAVTALATLVGQPLVVGVVVGMGASPCRRPPSGSPRWRKRTCSPPQIDEQHDAR